MGDLTLFCTILHSTLRYFACDPILRAILRGMLHTRIQFYSFTTDGAMRRHSYVFLLLFAYLGVAINSRPEIIGMPVSNLIAHPADIVSNAIILTIYLATCFAWIRWQKGAIRGGRFAYYARSLPIAPLTQMRLNRLLLVSTLLPLLLVPLVAVVTIKSVYLTYESIVFFCIVVIGIVAFIWRFGRLVMDDRESAAIWVFVGGLLLAGAAGVAPYYRFGIALLAVVVGHLHLSALSAGIRERFQISENVCLPLRHQWLAFISLAWARAWHGYREALVARCLTGSIVLSLAWYATVRYDMADRFWGFSATACGIVGWLMTGLHLAEVHGDADMWRYLRTLPRVAIRKAIAELVVVNGAMAIPLVCYIVAMNGANLLVAPERIAALLTAFPLIALMRVIRFLPDNWAVIVQGGVWVAWISCIAALH